MEHINEHFSLNRDFKNIFQYLLNEGLVLNLDGYYILKGFYQEAISRLNLFLEKNTKITLAEFRDLLKSNRKMALIYLENFDQKKLTKKIDNYRIKNNTQS